MDDLSFVPNISIGNVILACAPQENPAVVQNSNKYFQLPSFGDKTMPANDAAKVTTLNKIVFRLPTMSYNRLNIGSVSGGLMKYEIFKRNLQNIVNRHLQRSKQ